MDLGALIEVLRKTAGLSGFTDDGGADVPESRVGDDVLSRFLESSLPIKCGDSIGIIGENLIDSLKITSIDVSELVFKSKVTVVFIYLSQLSFEARSEGAVSLGNVSSFYMDLEKIWPDGKEFVTFKPELINCLERFQNSFDHIWINPCHSQSITSIVLSSCFLKDGGVMKTVLPHGTNDLIVQRTLAHELNFTSVERTLPANHVYEPPSSSRPAMEYFIVFKKRGAQCGNDTSIGLQISTSSTNAASIFDDFSRFSSQFQIAVSDFVNAQRFAKKLMQTVWLRGCYVVALLLNEANRSVDSKDAAAAALFEHRLLLSLKQSFFSQSQFIQSVQDHAFYDSIKDKLQFEALSPNRKKVSARVRLYSMVVDDCVRIWMALLNCPLAIFAKHHEFPPSWGIAEKSIGEDPISSFVLSSHLEHSFENSYRRFIEWMYSIVPDQIKRSALLKHELKFVGAGATESSQEVDLKISLAVAVDAGEEDDEQFARNVSETPGASSSRNRRNVLNHRGAETSSNGNGKEVVSEVRKKRVIRSRSHDTNSQPRAIKRKTSRKQHRQITKAVEIEASSLQSSGNKIVTESVVKENNDFELVLPELSRDIGDIIASRIGESKENEYLSDAASTTTVSIDVIHGSDIEDNADTSVRLDVESHIVTLPADEKSSVNVTPEKAVSVTPLYLSVAELKGQIIAKLDSQDVPIEILHAVYKILLGDKPEHA